MIPCSVREDLTLALTLASFLTYTLSHESAKRFDGAEVEEEVTSYHNIEVSELSTAGVYQHKRRQSTFSQLLFVIPVKLQHFTS